jgi:hypothetical protein
MGDNPPVTWYREVKDVNQCRRHAQLFLVCESARCHHHRSRPGASETFTASRPSSQVGRKAGEARRAADLSSPRRGVATNPQTGEKPADGISAQPAVVPPEPRPARALVD